MISGLRGNLAGKGPDFLLLDVGGVIYRVGSSSATLDAVNEVGDLVSVRTHLVVREDQLALFGFATEWELSLFESLIGVTGVGPRLACAILSRFDADELVSIIHAGNAELLSTVSGVGKKTAGRLIVDLRGKLPDTDEDTLPSSRVDEEVIGALRSLGYTAGEAAEAVGSLAADAPGDAESRIVVALQSLASD